MAGAFKIFAVCLRIWELICASVVLGLIGTYLSYLGNAHVTSGRMEYVIATASLGIIGSLALGPPLRYSFWACPFDLAMFVMWMVAFGLMVDLTGTKGCHSTWYWNNWGYYWGGYYTYQPVSSQSLVGTTACAQWRAVLAFAFMGGWTWLISMGLGVCVVLKERKQTRSDNFGNVSGSVVTTSSTSGENPSMLENEKSLPQVTHDMKNYAV